jgi:NAD(P)-dependent dehydrogenase (short-subunit alcohol dehydrogenase family)
MKQQKVWLITGAAKGFGFEIVKAVLASGDKVLATVRKEPEGLLSAMNYKPNLSVVVMDITNETEVSAGVDKGIGLFGKIDVLVNNAGFGIVAAIEEFSDAEVKRQYDTNVFGMLNVIRAVLPSMRKRRSGHLINFSSFFGYGALPGWALYGSTKYAVEGISVGLSVELSAFNIHVTALAPGLFRTQFLSTESYSKTARIIDDYTATPAGQARSLPEKLHGTQAGDPAKLAKVVVELASEENPPLHLPVGKDSLDMFRKSAAATSQEVEKWAGKFTPTEF